MASYFSSSTSLLSGPTRSSGFNFSSCVFPALALKSAIYSVSPSFFHWKMVFRNQAVVVLFATEVSQALSKDRARKYTRVCVCVCVYTGPCMHITIFLYVYITIINMFVLIPLTLFCNHRAYFSLPFPPLLI